MTCLECNSDNLNRMLVSINGKDNVPAMVCDECGYADTCADGHDPDFSTVSPASGYGPKEGVVDVLCRRCNRSGSVLILPDQVMFD